MIQSENKNGFTKVDHITFDVILPLLSTSAQSVFLRIYRQTIGWNKPVDRIADSHFKKKCGIKRRETISAAIKELESLNLITVSGSGKGIIKTYGIDLETLMDFRDRYEDGEYEI